MENPFNTNQLSTEEILNEDEYDKKMRYNFFNSLKDIKTS